MGTACEVLSDTGIATVGRTVRSPDVLVASSGAPGTARLVPDVVAAFELLSPTNPANERIAKVGEYHAVKSIQTYVIGEQESIGLTVFQRADDMPWTVSVALTGEVLVLPQLALELPVDEFYADVDVPGSERKAGGPPS